MKFFSVLLLHLIITFHLIAQPDKQVYFDASVDIGNPKIKGFSKYDSADQIYTLKGSGYNIWFDRDEFHFLYKKLKGNFILTANFSFTGTGTDPHRKVGWMIRATSEDNAAHISATLHGDGLTALQWRGLKGAFMRDPEDEIFNSKKNAGIIQLERAGKQFIMRVARWGEPLQLVGEHQMENFSDDVLAGLFICSHNENVIEEAKVWNVRIDQPVTDDYNPNNSGYLGSRLELLDVFKGTRKVIYESTDRFEAPNWMPDGKSLLYNANGSIFKLQITGGTPAKINTGSADRNNNDHGISFDGKLLAISHHRPGLPGGGSTVYVLPIEGGTPKIVTEKTPSYFHGWSPDSRYIAFVGQRERKTYDIYKVDVKNGSEIKLTSIPEGAHVDGPEYSPDEKYIYYNASITGTMQIWRMKPDGTEQEQITFDEYNNWFPHISPNGKWIVFLSYPPTINPNDHPLYKKVMLRIMPVSGGGPKVIAYLYGGQGTINVSSWSPDSKSIAFVSNSGK